MTWKTIVLGLKLNTIKDSDLKIYAKPDVLKEKIISLFVKHSLIYNDLTEEALLEDNFSADFLVAYGLNFFNLKRKKDLKILRDQVDFLLSNSNLNSPIGPFYSTEKQNNLALPVELFASKYMSRTVWSHWCTEFICLLGDLSVATKEAKYSFEARKKYNNLLQKILIFKGYPELYSDNLKLYQTPFYTSMIETGWIVNFEFCRQKLIKNNNITF